ncbi:MAG: tRNA (guanosine(37)-N1)-methyltransferase TrmD [Clostridia bacterium]|nr:tRNA (guanosine(37)-N1)-methyltransferase TrmD [Clostridia bacterium]
MRFDIMTLFPELVSSVLGESIIGRAQKAGYVSVHAHNIRDFANNKHNKVDDTPYGGGFGMLMMAPPIYDCYEFVKNQVKAEMGENIKSKVIYMSPQGKVLTQKKAQELAEYDNLIILCGHYEGIDSRVLEEIVDEEISIGDYVLTGGELPACVLVDSISRLREGVLADKKCYEDESISSGLLEYPQYTRPYEFHGKKVPDVLISGNHAEIDKWRAAKSLEITKQKRPDLLD